MEGLSKIMERLQKMTGVAASTEPMSEEEYTRFKCYTYNAGTGDLDKNDGYNCSKCKNKGYISFPKKDEMFGYWSEVQRECECQTVRRSIARLKRSGLGNIIRDYTFDKYETSEQWQAVLKSKAMEYSEKPDKAWFFIGGQSGSGKSMLCTAIAGTFLRQGKNVLYMLWRDDVNKIKSRITDAQAYEEIISSYKTADVLYIDDLFKNGKNNDGKVQPPTSADIQVAFEILNYRYSNKGLITIISSERGIHELVEIDEATASRISEMSFQKGFGFNVKLDKSRNYRLRGITEL